jgi:hypothetical protein
MVEIVASGKPDPTSKPLRPMMRFADLIWRGPRNMPEKCIDEMIQEYAGKLMKEGFSPAVVAEKFLSLGTDLFQTLFGTAATATRLEATANALRNKMVSDAKPT